MTDSTGTDGTCRDPGCGCGPTSRRDFIKVVGLAASSVEAGGRMPAMAGPIEDDNEYLQTIPRDEPRGLTETRRDFPARSTSLV